MVLRCNNAQNDEKKETLIEKVLKLKPRISFTTECQQKCPSNNKKKSEVQSESKSFKTQFKKLSILERELSSIFRSDLTLLTSFQEMKLLETEFQVPERKLLLASFFFEEINESSLDASSVDSFSTKSNFVTIGTFKHKPNVDSVLWLKREIWPKIRTAMMRRRRRRSRRGKGRERGRKDIGKRREGGKSRRSKGRARGRTKRRRRR